MKSWRGSRLVFASVALIAVTFSIGSIAWAASVQSSPTVVKAGQTVTVSGSGFFPFVPVGLCWDAAGCSNMGRITPGLGGSFSIAVTIPQSAEPGPHEIWGCQRVEGGGDDLCGIAQVSVETPDPSTTTTITSTSTTSTTVPQTTTTSIPPATTTTLSSSTTTTTPVSTTTTANQDTTTTTATQSSTTSSASQVSTGTSSPNQLLGGFLSGLDDDPPAEAQSNEVETEVRSAELTVDAPPLTSEVAIGDSGLATWLLVVLGIALAADLWILVKLILREIRPLR